jgi:hypothetical protein
MDDHSNLSGKLKRWHETYGAHDLHWPLTTESRKVRIQEIPAQLPADYLRMAEETEGLALGS